MQKNTLKKPAQHITERAFINNPGDFLLSHTASRAVPSAPRGLTSVFGMGTGVTLSTKSPENSKDHGEQTSSQPSLTAAPELEIFENRIEGL
jgi:hypothetical protein